MACYKELEAERNRLLFVRECMDYWSLDLGGISGFVPPQGVVDKNKAKVFWDYIRKINKKARMGGDLKEMTLYGYFKRNIMRNLFPYSGYEDKRHRVGDVDVRILWLSDEDGEKTCDLAKAKGFFGWNERLNAL